MPTKNIFHYVFERNYDNFFLFYYWNEFYKDGFFDKIKTLAKKTQEDEIQVTFLDLFEGQELRLEPKRFSLLDFKKISLELDGKDFLLDDNIDEYYLGGNTELWKFYLFQTDDICILGLDDSILDFARELFKPYKSYDIKTKLNSLTWMFDDDKTKNKLIQEMKKNYDF